MKLVFLGTSGYHATDERHTMGVFLPECGILIDAGSGTYRVSKYLQTNELDIFLSHAHLDHIQGLTHLFDIVHLNPLKRITVHGEGEKLSAIEEHLYHEQIFPERTPHELRPLTGIREMACGVRVKPFPVIHPGGAIGYRLDWPDRSLGYVTDTTATASAAYIKDIQGVDLLIHECYFPDSNAATAAEYGHSATSAVAELAKKAKVGRLLLVHFSPLLGGDDPIDIAQARSIFPATDVSRDLQEVEF
jgi:ribonuclease Z